MGKKKKWLRLIGFVFAIVVLFAGYYVYSMFSFIGEVSTQRPFSTGTNPLTTAKWEGNEQVNILFMGVDARDKNERPRSDTMLLASINPETKKMALFSIMRDSYVNIPGVGQSKINAAFANGGPELLIETIQKYLNTQIHYYVATDFEGFSKIVDAIGGVDVNVKEAMVHPDDGIYDIKLPAGQQHLDGEHALMYVRYRGGPNADFGRTERQRELGKIVAQQMKSPSMLLKLPSILKDVKPYVQTNLGGDDLLKLTALGLKLDTAGMKTEQLPPNDAVTDGTTADGEMILNVDIPATRKFYHGVIDAMQPTAAGGNTSGNDASSGGTSDSQGAGNGSSSGTQASGGGKNASGQKGSSKTQQASGPAVTVSGEWVNLRQKPGTDSEIIGKVYGGQQLTLVEDDGGWLYVQTPEGMYGYVSANLVTR
jgi:polyisoprenyl-teichoic acid--peptidoglycan teichoic acid transferase